MPGHVATIGRPMRSPLHLVLATALGSASIAHPAHAAPSTSLYQEGQRDYAEGRFEAAATKLEQAYKESRDPVMLYTLGRVYQDWAKSSNDIKHLRKAKDALEKFIVALEADPNIGDPSEIEPQIAELERKIAEAEAAAEPEPEPEPEPAAAAPPADPGKPAKIAGLTLIGLGGATFLAGAGVGAAFGLKGLQLRDDLTTNMCSMASAKCDEIREQGAKANTLTIVGWAALGGGGAVLAVVGAVLYVKGRKKTASWRADEQARLRVLPTWGGLTLQGRF
jgi:tetratricopeptide (TPR) repeat protein